MSTPRSRRRARRCPAGARCAGTRAARYLYAIARHVQKHSRLLAVLETLDNGKPIRETRDIDVPLVARHFYHHAGWAQLLRARVRRTTQPVGVVGQIIPWNFPLLMLAWKIAPALALGNTVVLKPAEFTPLTALLFAEICAEAGLAAGRGQHRHRRRRDRRGARRPPGRRQDRLHRLDRGRARSSGGRPRARGKKLSLELGGKSPVHRLRRRRPRQRRSRALVDAIWFNQGQVCCAGSRLLVQESDRRALPRQAAARAWRSCASATRSTRRIDIGAIVAPVQLERIERAGGAGRRRRARRCGSRRGRCPKEGCFYPPTLITERRARRPPSRRRRSSARCWWR